MARSKVVLPPDSTGQKMGITTYNNGTETVAASEVTLVAGDGTPLDTVPVSGTVSVGNFPASQAVTGTFFQATQPVSASTLPLPSGASTEATLALIKAKTDNLDVALSTRTKPADTQTISGAVTANAGTNLNTSALALDATVGTTNTRAGDLTETAPATDTASSGLNGRLQRIAQRITSLIALLPASLGQKTKANSLAVTLASDQDALPASQSGTWTVQPGNTANTTAWKVDGSAVTQPVSGTVTANQGGSNWSVNNAQVAGTTVSTGNGVSGTGVQRVTIASDSTGQVALAAGTNAIGKLTANSGVVIGDVNAVPPTLTKGTQGSTGFSVQNLTDAGRTAIGFTAQNVTAGTSGTEVMASFSQWKGGTVTGSVTSYTVTNGKRLRLVTLQVAITAQAATVTRLLVNIRSNSAGATTTGSNLVAGYDIGGPAVSGQTAYETIPLGEAFEFLGDGTLTIGVSFVPTWTTTAAKVSVTLHGYEY